jgi:hypothetical protein
LKVKFSTFYLINIIKLPAMLGRTEGAEAIELTKSAARVKLQMVSQAKAITGGDPYGRAKFITYTVALSVP